MGTDKSKLCWESGWTRVAIWVLGDEPNVTCVCALWTTAPLHAHCYWQRRAPAQSVAGCLGPTASPCKACTGRRTQIQQRPNSEPGSGPRLPDALNMIGGPVRPWPAPFLCFLLCECRRQAEPLSASVGISMRRDCTLPGWSRGLSRHLEATPKGDWSPRVSCSAQPHLRTAAFGLLSRPEGLRGSHLTLRGGTR